MKPILYFGAALVGLVNALPLPWRLRVGWMNLVGRLVRFLLPRVPGIYGMLSQDNVRYGMGKQGEATVETFQVFEDTLRALDEAHVDPAAIRSVYQRLHDEGRTGSDLARSLAEAFLEPDRCRRIFSRVATQ